MWYGGGEMEIAIILLLIALIVVLAMFIKAKINLTVLALWMAEKNYPPPENEDAEHLAKKIVDKWFRKN